MIFQFKGFFLSVSSVQSKNEIDDRITGQVIKECRISIPEPSVKAKERDFISSCSIEYSDGSQYIGETAGGTLRNGIGKQIFPNKYYYIVEWRNDEINGFGSLFTEKGECVYRGFWSGGKFNGLGLLMNVFPAELKGCLNHLDFKDIDDRWKSYQGEFIDDLMNGIGRIEFLDGDSFVGTFEGNGINGVGVFIGKSSGERISGVWRSGIFEGSL